MKREKKSHPFSTQGKKALGFYKSKSSPGPKGASSGKSRRASTRGSLFDGMEDFSGHLSFRQVMFLILGAFGLMIFFFGTAFFLSVRGAEKTLVPDIVGKPLVEALVSLQEKELYPRVQVKYTGSPGDKGQIMTQSPPPGSYVKAGRRINLMVSKGSIIDRVGDYLGQDIENLRSHLSTLVSAGRPLLAIKEPLIYHFDDAPAGRILGQYPPAETELEGPTDLSLVVSRGPGEQKWQIPNFAGYQASQAMDLLVNVSQPFVFQISPELPQGDHVMVRSQTPGAGEGVVSLQPMVLQVSPPARFPPEKVFGFFNYQLPQYPVPVELEVWERLPGKQPVLFFKMPHPGGTLSFPYLVEEGTHYTLLVYGEEKIRHQVTAGQ